MATVQDLQSAVIDAAHANAQAAKAIAKAATDRDRPDEIAAVEAAKVSQFGTAARDLCAALVELQRLPVKPPAGDPPDLYPATP
jgi:hypothetical protein